jgi:hypothetical protein
MDDERLKDAAAEAAAPPADPAAETGPAPVPGVEWKDDAGDAGDRDGRIGRRKDATGGKAGDPAPEDKKFRGGRADGPQGPAGPAEDRVAAERRPSPTPFAGGPVPTVILHMESVRPGEGFRDAVREVELALGEQRGLVRQKVWLTARELSMVPDDTAKDAPGESAGGFAGTAGGDGYESGERERNRDDGERRDGGGLTAGEAPTSTTVGGVAPGGGASGAAAADDDTVSAEDADDGDAPVAVLRIRTVDLPRLRAALARARDLRETHASLLLDEVLEARGAGGAEPAPSPAPPPSPAGTPRSEEPADRAPPSGAGAGPVPPPRLSPEQLRRMAEPPAPLPADTLLLDTKSPEIEVRIRLTRAPR